MAAPKEGPTWLREELRTPFNQAVVNAHKSGESIAEILAKYGCTPRVLADLYHCHRVSSSAINAIAEGTLSGIELLTFRVMTRTPLSYDSVRYNLLPDLESWYED